MRATAPESTNARVRARASLLAAAVAVTLGAVAAPAGAVIGPPATIDGPSQDIVDFGGLAMAQDGTGGLVYIKRAGGVNHVFASRYVEGRWSAPIQVDAGQPYAASWPRIGAFDGGGLEVVWATPFATDNSRPVYQLLGAELGPGADRFASPLIVDPDVRNATGLDPSLAMSSTGQADLAYRVVLYDPTQVSPVTPLRPGDVALDTRVAHFGAGWWYQLGVVNRNRGLSNRSPTSDNAPAVAIGPTGEGLVAWQEPDESGAARIWARRIFGRTLGDVMPVSLTTFNQAAITDDADAPSAAISQFGEAEVAYRQRVSRGSPLPGPRVLVNHLSGGEGAVGVEFDGAKFADPTASVGSNQALGAPTVDVDTREDARIVYAAGATARVVLSSAQGLAPGLSLGPPVAGGTTTAAALNPDGGGLAAWPSTDRGGLSGVAVREDFPTGAAQTGLLGGSSGGPVSELAVGRSGLGDGLVGFLQGPVGNASVVAAAVTAPPAQFVIGTPADWVRTAGATVTWEPAPSANEPVTYTVVLDGRVRASVGTSLGYTFSSRAISDGAHALQVLATDALGQQTLTAPADLKLDGNAPTIVVRQRGGRRVIVHVRDRGSGVDPATVRCSFGDGQRGRGRAVLRHRYARPGVYWIVLRAADLVGNRATWRRPVVVR